MSLIMALSCEMNVWPDCSRKRLKMRVTAGFLKILRHHSEREAAKAPDLADQLKVAEMRRHPHGTVFVRLRLCFRIGDVDDEMLLPGVRRELGRPEEVEKRAGEDLIGATGDALTLGERVLITKRAAQVFERCVATPLVAQIGE
jgi:hypothetical protein